MNFQKYLDFSLPSWLNFFFCFHDAWKGQENDDDDNDFFYHTVCVQLKITVLNIQLMVYAKHVVFLAKMKFAMKMVCTKKYLECDVVKKVDHRFLMYDIIRLLRVDYIRWDLFLLGVIPNIKCFWHNRNSVYQFYNLITVKFECFSRFSPLCMIEAIKL